MAVYVELDKWGPDLEVKLHLGYVDAGFMRAAFEVRLLSGLLCCEVQPGSILYSLK